jgi:hypothetical protein
MRSMMASDQSCQYAERVEIVLDREAQQPYDGIGAAVHRSGWTQQVSE